MPTLPIPVFGALILLFLFARLWLRQGRLTPLTLLLAFYAIQTFIIALAQHYMVPGMRFVQPISASLVPPMAWWAFQRTAVRGTRMHDALHLTIPLSALACLKVAPSVLDVFIPVVFIAYGAAILRKSLSGPDAQPRALLSGGDGPVLVWSVIAISLIASAFSDVLIVVAHVWGLDVLKPWLISVFSVGNLVLIGLLSLSGKLETDLETVEASSAQTQEPDEALWQALQTHMSERRPYLDPQLSLVRLARQLGVPAKALSATINSASGENVSRFVNKARIRAAEEKMLEGQSVIEAMLSSGFNTKSNFNREFLRINGQSPSQWLATRQL